MRLERRTNRVSPPDAHRQGHRTFHWDGARYLRARWPYRFVLQSLGPGTSRNDSLADRTEWDGVGSPPSPPPHPEMEWAPPPPHPNPLWAPDRRLKQLYAAIFGSCELAQSDGYFTRNASPVLFRPRPPPNAFLLPIFSSPTNKRFT